mmetsp:Transcript_1237/g.1594  ORF Transcript_1237/g.1594 Transcript_1237/m.1594 type:complete len:1397 (-) Transcript_1237:136-4326(-)
MCTTPASKDKTSLPSSQESGSHEPSTPVSIEDNASCLSRMLLLYLDPLLRLGATRAIELEDLGAPSKTNDADTIHKRMKHEWKMEVARTERTNLALTKKYENEIAKGGKKEIRPPKMKQPSGFMVLLRTAGKWKIAGALGLYVVSALLQFVPVLLLNDLVSYFESGGASGTYKLIVPPWAEVFGLFMMPLLVSIVQTQHQVLLLQTSICVRTALSTMLYEKSLSISAAGRACTSTGQVVNMMSNDTQQLQRFFQLLGMTASSPVTIILALVLIYREVGNATWVGVAFMIVLAPVNMCIFSMVGKLRRKVLKYSDLRVKIMNEILSGIRIIKFYAWEKPFGKEVGKMREKELKALTGLAYVSAVGFSFILLSAPIVQPVLVFLTYTKIQDESLTAATAFTTVALFQIMRFPFAFLPMGLMQYIQARIAITRLTNYLILPDLDDCVVAEGPPGGDDTPGSITFKNASFSWIDRAVIPPAVKKNRRGSLFSRKKNTKKQADNAASQVSVKAAMPRNASNTSLTSLDGSTGAPRTTSLHNISLEIPSGSLVAVVGSVGSGKSSLLSAMMGEMEAVNEESVVYVPGKKDGFVSYAAQTPWIVNETLRDNVLFGREYDKKRYEAILKVCALEDDIAILPAGDMTEIGERGINLSGGQKARVALARSIYSERSRVVLLDDPLSAVDAHVGEHIFSQAIKGDLVDGVTRVLVTHHVHFLPRCDMVIVLEDGCIKHVGEYNELVENGVDFKGAADFDEKNASMEKEATEGRDEGASQGKGKVDDSNNADMKKKGENLISSEEKNTGDISKAAYIHYAKAGGLIYVFLVIFIQFSGRAAEIMTSFWLSWWAENAIKAEANQTPLSPSETTYYLNIFALFSMLSVLGLTGRACAMAIHRLHASRKLHDELTDSVLRAPVSFFDVTPLGRVLNRFAADMDKVDLELTQNLSQGVNVISNILGAVGAMVAATKGAFLVPLLPIGFVYYQIQKWFRKTSTELQRVTSIATSPIFTDFSQILSGTSTVRAYGEENRFFTKCRLSFNNMNAAYSVTLLTNYWLGLRLDLIGGFVMAFIGGFAVATESTNFIPAGWLGVSLSYAIEITSFLKYGVRMVAQVEADMSSTERVLYYTQNITPEAPDVIPDKDPKQGTWPNEGVIDIQHASMRYRDGPLVLKNITVKLRAAEKVGVVGRTGSGKSSLMNLLFRICELEKDGGKVTIDDIDTSTIGTEALRLNLSIIPQDPVLFSNTVRYNLDPFNKCSDEEVWSVIRKVNLESVIAVLPQKLEEMVTEGGENFSQGQRQLLCIARSLLRKPKILVMDEATASIDNETDALIQRMIRENFKNATVLTIAHRLNTIMDSDRVLVLDDGKVAEFDTVDALMAKNGGIFRSMVEKSRSTRAGGLSETNQE